jgi:hypothetical protein
MTTALVGSDLDGLAREINAEHAQVVGAARFALEHARLAGDALLRAQRLCMAAEPHSWLSWLDDNCYFHERTARRYMSVARNWDLLCAESATVADLTLRGAVKLIATRSPPPEEESPAEEAPSDVPLDPLGLPLPDRSLPAFAGLEAWREAARQAEALARLVGGLEKEPGGEYLAGDGSAAARALRAALDRSAPHAGSCPACYRPAEPPDPDCLHCRGLGWLSRHAWHSCPPELRARHVRRLAINPEDTHGP